MTALELTPEERKRAETNCPHCRAKIVPQLGNGFKHYECGTGYMGYPKSSNCKRDAAMGEIERLREQIAEYETVRHAMAVELLQVKNESAVRQENHALKVRLIAALKKRDEAREALRFIAEWGGRTLESEYGDIDCNGKWCAEQAKEAAE